MLKVYKGLNIAYYIVSSFLGVILALILISINVNEILALVIIALWIIVNSIVFNSIANKRGAALINLRDSCNTRSFVNEYAKLLPNQKEGSSSDALVRLNMAAGYLDLGDVQGAMNIMSRVNLPEAKFNNFAKGLAAVYHSNFCLAFIKSGDIPMAEKALAACYNVVNDEKFPPAERGKFLKYCALRQAQIDIATGNPERIDGAEKAFLDYFHSSETLLEKVSAGYWLARIKYMQGDREEEKKYLNYTYANGGDTMYGMEAKRILEGYKAEEASYGNYIDDITESIPEEEVSPESFLDESL